MVVFERLLSSVGLGLIESSRKVLMSVNGAYVSMVLIAVGV